jgi:hypothetical protein
LFVYMVQIHSSNFQTPLRPTKWMTPVFWQFTLPICWCSLLYNWRQKGAHHSLSNKHQTYSSFWSCSCCLSHTFLYTLRGEKWQDPRFLIPNYFDVSFMLALSWDWIRIKAWLNGFFKIISDLLASWLVGTI